MMKLLLTMIALATLAGCTTMSAQQSAARDDQTCESYGVKPGSNGYVLCRMQLTQNEHEDDQQRRANMEVLGARLMNQR